MADINTSINGIDITVKKLDSGEIVYASESWPGASFGPNGSGLVSGHVGSILSADRLQQFADSNTSSIESKNWFINNATEQINDPKVDPAWKATLQGQIDAAMADIQSLQESRSAALSLASQVDTLTAQVNDAPATNGEAAAAPTEADAQNTATTTNPESATNPSKEDADTEDKYKNQSATDPGPPAQDDGSDPYVSNGQTTVPPADNPLPKNGESTKTASPPARAEWPDAKDVRAILKVPPTYLNGVTDPGRVLNAFGGIVFPYTPQISFSHDASYTGVNPTHSNYTQYFYKNSSVSAISVNAKFTVQNEDDAIILVGVLTLLRALTKMKFGPDKDAGAPPPVCRFSAYGNYMLNNVPVTVASFRHDLPDSVDYFQTGNSFRTHGLNFVPVMSTISLTLNPTYSRSEMMRAGVTSTLTGKAQKSGFL